MRNIEEIPRPNKISEKQKADFEKLLWKKAEELSEIRQALQVRLNELEQIFEKNPIESLNLHQVGIRRNQEGEYWRIKEKINDIKEQESQIEQALSDLDKGTADMSQIEKLTALPKQENSEALSKRKQRILEDKQRMGIDPREIMADMYGEFGSEKMHLTTGRNVKMVKNLGQVTPEGAANEFFHATTDTHGGKTKHGKKGDVYVSKSGKRIRKF